MKFMEKVWASIGLFDPEPEPARLPRPEQDEGEHSKYGGTHNVVNLPSSQPKSQMRVIIMEPSSFDEAQQVADYLKNYKPVVVNFENTEPEVAKRLIDFISGTTYAIGGQIQKVGQEIFLCAPSNVDVSNIMLHNMGEKSSFSWMNPE